MLGENPALYAGLEACPNSRHKSIKAEKTVIALLVYILAIATSKLEKVRLTPSAHSILLPYKYNCCDGMHA